MAQQQVTGSGIEQLYRSGRATGVAQMSLSSQNTAFQRGGIVRILLEQVRVVIAFQQYHIRAQHRVSNGFGKMAQVGGYGDTAAAGQINAVAHRLIGVMGDGKGVDFQPVQHEKAFPRLHQHLMSGGNFPDGS